MITPQSGVPNDVPPGARYSGTPAVEHRQWLKNAAAIGRVPELAKTVRQLEAEVARLKAQVGV
jgi:UDP-3-O-[3-hydroxymyristoyl] glucosamine N-acyltransferase